MFKYSLVFLICFLGSLSAEKSMFGAGDLESSNPYGLTSAEKVIIKNKQILNKNRKIINKVDSSIKELYERVEGLESVSNGDAQKLDKTYKNLNKHIEDFESLKSDLYIQLAKKDEKIKVLEDTIASLNDIIDQNNNNITLLKESLDKVTITLNKINKEYISRKDFKSLLGEIEKSYKPKKSYKSKQKISSGNKITSFKKPKKQLLQDARRYFKKDYFTKALPILEYLIKSNYRPAECNYYVGEIKYYRKKYSDALYFYKTSMMLYDKAKYLPRLLLHSAISFEKTKDYDQAKNFYSTLIEVYPNSSEAKQASKKIKQLN